MTRYVFNVAGGVVSGLWQLFTWCLCDFCWLHNKLTLRDNKEIPVICSLIVLITIFVSLKQKDECMPMCAPVFLPLKSHKLAPHSWSGWIYMYISLSCVGLLHSMFLCRNMDHMKIGEQCAVKDNLLFTVCSWSGSDIWRVMKSCTPPPPYQLVCVLPSCGKLPQHESHQSHLWNDGKQTIIDWLIY